MLETIAAWAAPARVTVAYPGLWIRPDVYATHGHYLDCHLTVPTLERLSVGVDEPRARPPRRRASTRSRTTRPSPAPCSRGETRSRRVAPTERRAQRNDDRRRLAGAAGRRRRGRPRHRRRRRAEPSWARAAARSRESCAGAPSSAPSRVAVAALNRAGLGPLRPRSPVASCAAPACGRWGRWRSGSACGESHVVFGHTHRAGPLRRATASPSGAGAAARGSSTPAAGPIRRSS